MDNEKVNEVFRAMIDLLRAGGYTPHRLDGMETNPGPSRALNHAMALCLVALEMGPERLEKKFRWLGFVQGVLWTTGMATIEILKRMNAPANETHL